MCQPLGPGVTRSKRRSMQWLRTAAETGRTDPCVYLARAMYLDLPYAREVGHVMEAAGVAASAGVMEGHDVPPHVLTSVVHWLQRWGGDSAAAPTSYVHWVRMGARIAATTGARLWAF